VAIGPVPITIAQSILFGIVQGLTEFLPVSSTAHLRILPELLGISDPGSAFTAVIQLGTILAVWIYFWKDLTMAIRGWAHSILGPKTSPEAKLGWAVFWGSVPICLFGFLLRHAIKSDAVRSLYVIAATLIIVGLVMMLAEMYGKKNRKLADVTVRDGIIVGIWQCFALVPGVSRSGSTISGGLFDGFDRVAAARISFLLSVPSITIAGLYELFDDRKDILGSNMTPAIVATIVSFIVGYASIGWFIGFLKKHGIGYFVVYRIALGIALIVLIRTGVLHAQKPNTDTVQQTTASAPQIDRAAAWEQAMQSNAEQHGLAQ
jgi:undecaprenyl-diphosphatase